MIPLVITESVALLITGIMSALAGIGGTIASATSKRRTEERQNQYNIDAEQRQNQYNIDAEQRERGYIAEQNEYNSPAAQMQRYREAGLNPYLVDDPGNQGVISSVDSVDSIPGTALDIGTDLQKGLAGVGDSIASTGNSFESVLLEQKRRQLDMYKIDAEIQRAKDQLSESQRQFDLNYQLQQSDRAYREARDIIEDNFKTREIEIKSSGLSLEKEKFELNKLYSQRNFELAKARDSRDAERHRLEIEGLRIQNEHNRDAQDFFKQFQLPNDKLKSQLEKVTLSLSDDDYKLVKDCTLKTYKLRQKMLNNQISYQEYVRDARAIWDFRNGYDGRYATQHKFDFSTGSVYRNPYEGSDDSPLESAASIALKLFGL